ncbi:hypothetical protein [Tumebacillus permanentifrigoris]|uniref:hypothetical protein n=1 Tax=Tumebacillus permanentifrigoris TaxID=378543 RepID=UPI000D6D9DAA|nr:hypothetical protein [Tumebacillus permanentifrigoris]
MAQRFTMPVAAQLTGEIVNREPEKCDELSWHPFEALPDNMIPYIRRAIENYRDQAWFSSFGWGEV